MTTEGRVEPMTAAPVDPDLRALSVPWHRETVGHSSIEQIAMKVLADLSVPPGDGLEPNTDATWIANADNKIVAFVGNGPRQTDNADAIIEAVARLSAPVDRVGGEGLREAAVKAANGEQPMVVNGSQVLLPCGWGDVRNDGGRLCPIINVEDPAVAQFIVASLRAALVNDETADTASPVEVVEPWSHPYEAHGDGLCIHCGFVGSYAHTEEFYRKWVWPASRPAPAPSEDVVTAIFDEHTVPPHMLPEEIIGPDRKDGGDPEPSIVECGQKHAPHWHLFDHGSVPVRTFDTEAEARAALTRNSGEEPR